MESEEAATVVKEASFTRSALSGCFAGMCQTYAGHPLDTIKVKWQSAKPGEYRGLWDCVANTYKTGGVRAFYDGAVPALATAVIENTLVFGANEVFKKAIMKAQDDPTRPLPITAVACVGAAAGFFQGIFACPAEVIKCRLQAQAKGVEHTGATYKGPLDCGRRLVAESGVGALYRGFVPFVAREVPFYFVFFSSYEAICAVMEKRNNCTRDHLPASEVFVAGGLAGCISWTTVVPADTIKSQMQAGNGLSLSATIRQTYIQHGFFNGFFRGWVPIMIRAFPANAATFLGFELCRRYLPDFI